MAQRRSLHLEWISSSEKSEPILSLLADPDFVIIQSGIIPLPTGATRYSFIILSLNHNKLHALQERIDEISYQPLTFSFNVVSLSFLTQRKYGQSLVHLLTPYLTCQRDLPVVDIHQTYLSNPETIILEPRGSDGLPFYVSTQERQEMLIETKDLDHLIGYDLLTADPLVWYYLDRNNISPSNWYLVSWRGMALIPIDAPREEDEPTTEVARVADIFDEPEDDDDQITGLGLWSIATDEFVTNTRMFTSSLRREGFFILSSGINLTFARQFGEMWKIGYYGSYTSPDHDQSTYHVFRADSSDLSDTDPNFKIGFTSAHDLGLETPSWFRESLLQIELGYLPTIPISGSWIQFVEPTLSNMAILQYAAIRAYYQVGTSLNPTLLGSIWQVKCLPNLIISAPFASWQEVLEFTTILTSSLLPQTRNWYVIESPDLPTAEYRRLLIQQKEPDLQPMAMTIPADPTGVYLVVDTSSGQNPIILPDESNITSLPTPQPNQGLVIDVKPIPVNGQVQFKYIANVDPTYMFSINDLPILTTSTNDPFAVATLVASNLLSPWGESYLRYNPNSKIERFHLQPERVLRRIIRHT